MKTIKKLITDTNYKTYMLFLFFSVTAYLYISVNQTPAPSDSCYYLVSAAKLSSTNNISHFINFILSYPITPLLIVLPFLPFKFFYVSLFTAQLTMISVYLLTILSLYGIGLGLKNKKAAIVAAVSFGATPIIFGMGRTFMPDPLLTLFVALSFYFLQKTNNFTNLKYSLLLGLALGFGSLSKATFPVFIFLPILFHIKRKSLPTIFYTGLIAAAIALPWYSQNFINSWMHYSETKNTATGLNTLLTNLTSLSRLFTYLKIIIFEVFSIPHFIFICISCVLLLGSEKKTALKLLSYMLFPLIIILAISETILARYLMPVNVFAAIIIAKTIGCKKHSFSLCSIYILIYLSLSFLPSFDYLGFNRIFPFTHTKQNPHTAIFYGNFGLNTEPALNAEAKQLLKNLSPEKILFLSDSTSPDASIIENIFIAFALRNNITFMREGDIMTKDKTEAVFSFKNKNFLKAKDDEVIILFEDNKDYGVSLKEFNESAGLMGINEKKIQAVKRFKDAKNIYRKVLTLKIFDKNINFYQANFSSLQK